MVKKTLFFVLAFLACAQVAKASPVFIENAGFEAGGVGDGNTPGWTLYNPGFLSKPSLEVDQLYGGVFYTELQDDYSLTIAEGRFGEVGLSQTSGDSPANRGQSLGIRLLNKNQSLSDPQAEADIDDIRLTRIITVPIPATAWLFGTALIGFVIMSRRRNLS